jgi:hypothetical protein
MKNIEKYLDMSDEQIDNLLLGVDFVKRKKQLDQEDLQILEIEAAQIGGVLHNHLIEV